MDKDNNISQENNKEGIPDKNNLALNDANSLINNKQNNNEDKLTSLFSLYFAAKCPFIRWVKRKNVPSKG